MAVALIALFVALGGTSYAVSQLPANSVGSAGPVREGRGTALETNLETGEVREVRYVLRLTDDGGAEIVFDSGAPTDRLRDAGGDEGGRA
jgi:hypothetical protein